MDTLTYYVGNIETAKEGGNTQSIGEAFLNAASVPVVFFAMDANLKEECITGLLDDNNPHQVKRLKAILDKYKEPREDVTALNEQNSENPDAIANMKMVIREIERANNNGHATAVEHLLIRHLSLPKFVEMIDANLVQACFDRAFINQDFRLSEKIWHAANDAGIELHPEGGGVFRAQAARRDPK